MQQIGDWLKRLGLGQYARCFAENDIDFSILYDLADQDLEKIGVQSLGHRRKLLRAMADLKDIETRASAIPIAAAVPAVAHSPDGAERRHVTVMFCEKSFRAIRSALPKPCVASTGSWQDTWGMACWSISAIPEHTRTTLNG